MKQSYISLGENNGDLNHFVFYVIKEEWFAGGVPGEDDAGLDTLTEHSEVVDLDMPNLDGMELVEWIQEQDDLRGFPVIGKTLNA